MVNAKILYIVMVKISNLFDFFLNLCAISKVALVKCIWLNFKLIFDLDDDVYWI